ncbi:hypothetical protein T265_10598 [Opisthorchis viverrini]|uniref:MORN repeat protein n=1 Tax=Opisthorchis viverrini TaxID=6198 RepID=A0A074ZCP0_OPIVI|nr:hypothetical protein T265_10598 [Opisthorchis viverrini]KER20965.1 hypothetical protein T265_10598 [Opisthorchis viverrini]
MIVAVAVSFTDDLGGEGRPSQMKSADYLHPQNNWNNAIFILSAQGRLEYTSDGSCYYEGDWFEDIRQGYGVSKYPDGTTYEGEWFDGNRCGYGTMHWKDRDEIYSGRWVAGKQMCEAGERLLRLLRLGLLSPCVSKQRASSEACVRVCKAGIFVVGPLVCGNHPGVAAKYVV